MSAPPPASSPDRADGSPGPAHGSPSPAHGSPSPAATPADRRWHRLHPLSPVVRLWRALVVVLLALVPSLGFHRQGHGNRLAVEASILGLLLVLGTVSWLVTRWSVDERALRIDTGLIRRSSKRFPLAQVQAIDVVQPGVARVLGLAELRVRMGGSSAGQARLAYLAEPAAIALRARLLALAHGLAEDVPAPPERILLSVPPGRLVASLLVSSFGLVLVALLVLAVGLSTVSPQALAASLGVGVPYLIGFATVGWRRFNGGFELTVAEAPDGLRLRSGLIERTAETIPAGRVQAVRLSQPLMWRPWGWCRLEVDVAGRQRKHRENSAEAGRLRAVLPVGSSAEASWLLSRILPAAPAADRPAPAPARWKSPLSFHWLSWGADDRVVVTVSGRVRRVTHWVPLAKVQSIRVVEGPLQRRLGLATVHLDTAGRALHAALRDRSTGEVRALLPGLVDAARRARHPSAPPAPPTG